MTRDRAADALSALAVGAVLAVLLARRDAALAPVAVAAGAVGAALLEALLLRHRERVRRLWERPRVRWGATLVGGAAAVAVGPFAPAWALWALLGGVCGYLTLLVAATVEKRRSAA
ncbi:hypothetical protein [Halostella litorea]|uniref:hypothetical protein n=1 Tax=Halostella litorea TaxID=2528831 RepID=UPI0010926BB5|nr:hypothetical protein [Halostella litorea]